MKNILKILICIFGVLMLGGVTFAAENKDFEKIYASQYETSNASDLVDKIPKESKKILNGMEVKSPEWKNFANISFQKVFEKIFEIMKEKISVSKSSFFSIVFIILIHAVVRNFKSSFGSKEILKVMDLVSILCVCTIIINPIVKCVGSSSKSIQSASEFTLCSVPVISSILVASGHTLSATSYQTLVIVVGQVIAYVSKFFLVPFINVLFGMSIISSFSPNTNLESFCKTICKFLKTTLKFISYIFTSILALQNLVTRSADNLGISTVKFAIDNCVPIVGGALSDSFSTVHACIKLLKSGVCAFGIMACGAIFLPVIVECFTWITFLNIGIGTVNILGLKKINSIFSSAKNIISINLAIILCVLSVLTVSCFVLILIGR